MTVLGIGVGVSQCQTKEETSENNSVQSLGGEVDMCRVKVKDISRFLRDGYEFFITENPVSSNLNGTLVRWRDIDSVDKLYEVDVDEFVSNFQNIRENLLYKVCAVRYDLEEQKIVSSIEKIVYSGPYNERALYQVVSDLQVSSSDLFSSFVYLNRKIESVLENKDIKEKLKKKEI